MIDQRKKKEIGPIKLFESYLEVFVYFKFHIIWSLQKALSEDTTSFS